MWTNIIILELSIFFYMIYDYVTMTCDNVCVILYYIIWYYTNPPILSLKIEINRIENKNEKIKIK